jgi:(R,R)-butanediol dehydrogenase/meso-butanediol dehydrogenase/diacetyl reductase
MKAAYYEGNRNITVGEGKAIAPGPDEVRLDVAYAGVCGTDLHILEGFMDDRVSVPHVMGHEMSGVVAEVCADVKEWHVGDRVVVRPLDPCNHCPACRVGHFHICHTLKVIGVDAPGAFQNSCTVPAHTLHRLPHGVGLDRGALIEPLSVACHDVRLGEVKPGDYAVIIGGGPIGILIALVARNAGARVLVSEISPFRIEFARELGLEVVDPTKVDLKSLVEGQTDGAGADVVFEVSASAEGASAVTQLARTRARIVIVGIFSEVPRVDLFRVFLRELRLCGARVYEREDFEKAISLAEEGSLPIDRLITSVRPLAELPDVLLELTSGANSMKTLIKMERMR